MAAVIEHENIVELRELLKELLDREYRIRGPYSSVEELYKPDISIYQLPIPEQTTLLAIAQLGGKAGVEDIMKKTGMARSTEAKHLSRLSIFGYVETSKDATNPRRKIYNMTKKAQDRVQGLPLEYSNELISTRLNDSII